MKLIVDYQGNLLDSYAISLESFRSFRGPLFRKPVTGQELLLPFLKQTGSSIDSICLSTEVLAFKHADYVLSMLKIILIKHMARALMSFSSHIRFSFLVRFGQ